MEQFIKEIKKTHTEILKILELPPPTLQKKIKNWTVKDAIAHIISWRKEILEIMKRVLKEESPKRINFRRMIKNLDISVNFSSIPDSFSDNEVGYIPWKGEKNLRFESRFPFFINKKILYFTPSLDFEYYKELEEPYVFTMRPNLSITLSNLVNFYSSIGYKRDFELGKKFESPIFDLSIGNLFLKSTRNKFIMYIQAYATKIYNPNPDIRLRTVFIFIENSINS